MTGFDWAILIVIALSVVVAAAQGFFFEMFSLAGVVVGYLLAAWEYWRVAPFFEPYVKSPAAANAAGYVTIFFCVMLLAGAAGKIARWAMKEVGMRWVDRLLGGAFGLLRGAVIVSVAVLAIAAFAPESKLLERSQLGQYFLVGARSAAWIAPSDLRQKLNEGVFAIRKQRLELLTPPAADAQKKNQKNSASTTETHNR